MGLSLKHRRLRARGYSIRQIRIWGNRNVFLRPVGVRASLTTALASANDDLTFRANYAGTAGNSLRVRYVVAGANTPLTVSRSGNDVTVNVATSAGSTATSTALQVRDAVNAASKDLLLSAELAPANTGAGVVSALAFTNLTGGAG